MKKEIITKTLPCVLTRDELDERAKKLAAANQATNELEKEKKQVMDQFKAQQSAFEADITNLSGQITSGKEYRRVDCQWEYDFESGFKRFLRLDTFEEVDRAKITEDERQERLI